MVSLTRGKLAKQFSITVETVRFYEQQGLLAPERADNGYRLYNSDCVERLKFILHAKRVGLSIEDIKELLSIQIDPKQHTCQEVKEITEAKLSDIENKIKHLQQMYTALTLINQRCCGGTHSAENCTILSALSTTKTQGC
jgi:MerR family Zn(II)-responsive transcriptional regulator of zntA